MWVAKHALPSGVLAEQVHPFTDAPLSVSPLTWSHAAFVAAFLEYVERRAAFDPCPGCGRPIPPGASHVVAWRADDLRGEEAALADRRHWHTRCWTVS